MSKREGPSDTMVPSRCVDTKRIENSDIEEGTRSKELRSAHVVNLYDEVYLGLARGFLMFCVPDLRNLAKDGMLEGDPSMIQRIIDLPASLLDISTIYERNKRLFLEKKIKDPDRAQFYEDAFRLKKTGRPESTFMDVGPRDTVNGEILESNDDYSHSRHSKGENEILAGIYCVHFEDENEEEECVYCISVNPYNETINVTFRGSVTSQDFRKDGKAILATIPNPLPHAAAIGLKEEVGIHLGFREYLYDVQRLKKVIHIPYFRSKGHAKTVVQDSPALKYQVILTQLHALFDENPTFRLTIAGHSLGGALCNLLGLEASADPKIPNKPVTCISSGAPKVGNIDFLRTFEHQERAGNIRCLQVANNRDPIPLSPPNGNFDPISPWCCQSRKFRHVGLQLRLRDDGYKIIYPIRMTNFFTILLCDYWVMCRVWAFVFFTVLASLVGLIACFYICIPCTVFASYRMFSVTRLHHSQLKYIYRLEDNEEELAKLSMDELNHQRFQDRSRFSFPILHQHKHKKLKIHKNESANT